MCDMNKILNQDTMQLQIPIRNLSHHSVPRYMSEHAAGMDVCAYIEKPIVIKSGDYRAIPTGLHVQLPLGYELQVRARSGLAFKNGVGLVNGVGTIDADYRGEIKILLINHGRDPFIVHDGDRIAQFIVCKHETVLWQLVDTLDETKRGEKGFGSTGNSD